MQASFIRRFYIYSLQKGISNSEWYDWDANNGGLGSTTANTAYGQVESWGWQVRRLGRARRVFRERRGADYSPTVAHLPW